MLRKFLISIPLFALVACAGVDVPAPAPVEPDPVACISPADVPEQAGGMLVPVKELRGKDAVAFFNATGGEDSGLPLPDVIGIFVIVDNPDIMFVVLFRGGCMYGQGQISREDVERLVRASLGLTA